MAKNIRAEIYKLLEEIDDDVLLTKVKEEVVFYKSKIDIVDELTETQSKELDKSIQQADNGETIPWNDFKKEMREWTEK